MGRNISPQHNLKTELCHGPFKCEKYQIVFRSLSNHFVVQSEKMLHSKIVIVKILPCLLKCLWKELQLQII